jgi:hypothetical protein
LDRENAYLSMLEAAANIQFNVSLILEAKAVESVKVKNWLCNHLSNASFSDNEAQLIQVIDFHQQIVDVIEGLTKLENGLGKNLKIVLGHNESRGTDGFDGMGSSL